MTRLHSSVSQVKIKSVKLTKNRKRKKNGQNIKLLEKSGGQSARRREKSPAVCDWLVRPAIAESGCGKELGRSKRASREKGCLGKNSSQDSTENGRGFKFGINLR
ncbi:hypothetical protein TNIN_384331 [Trichonephila inaurata madagascariensis]|uniref:Uncharacterized protein n=1 Tax=Trichonephila inaurata madagascariensis TaxID=2747483 RepID=A0A8X7C475_9ARAC|nr:hypothetical protein TNIN_384331 [Trichonephila inaurata madagascariensis]